MSVIRNDGPRPTTAPGHVRPTTPAEALKRATIQIAATDSVGATSPLAQTQVQEQQSFSSVAERRKDTVARFDQLAARFLSAPPNAVTPAGKLETGAAATTGDIASTLLALPDAGHAELKSVLREMKSEVTAAATKVFLQQTETAAKSAATQHLIAHPDVKKLASIVSSMVSSPRAQKVGAAAPNPAGMQDAASSLASRAGEASIEQLVMLVMMVSSHDAGDEVRGMLADMKANNTKKKAMREQMAKMRSENDALQQAAHNASSVSAEADNNVKQAELALSDANAAVVTAERALAQLTGPGASGDAVQAATAAADAARTAQAAAQQALNTANAAKTAINGLSSALGSGVRDPAASAADPLSGLNGWCLDSNGEALGYLRIAYNKGRPAAEQATDAEGFFLKYGLKPQGLAALLDPSHNGPDVAFAAALTNLRKLAELAGAAKDDTSFTEAQRLHFRTLFNDANDQMAALRLSKETGLPREFCMLQVKAAARGGAQAAAAAALALAKGPPATTAHLKEAMHSLVAAVRADTSGDAEEIATRGRAADAAERFENRIPKVVEPGSNADPATDAFCVEHGITSADGQRLRDMFEQLPANARGGASNWMQWAHNAPGLKTLSDPYDYQAAKDNAQLLREFADAAASTLVNDSTTAADAANTKLSEATDKQTRVTNVTAQVSQAKLAQATTQSALLEAKAIAAQARATSGAKQAAADASKAKLDKMKDDLDSIGDLSSEMQLKMQMYMERMQKVQQTLSAVMASFAKTSEAVIGNMK